jgi:hypothetical protein
LSHSIDDGEQHVPCPPTDNVTALCGTIHVYPTLALPVQQAALGLYGQ